MEVLKDEDPKNNPEIKALVQQIALKEAEAFDRIFKRFCWLHGLAVNIANVDYNIPDHVNRPNFWEYYYIGPVRKSTDRRHFLMSREVKFVDGKPTLEIIFNQTLLKEEDV